MKRILIPTDFSAIADNALAYAIQVAAAFESKLFLYHIYDIRKSDYDLDLSNEDQPIRKEAERKMANTQQKFQELIVRKKLSLQTKIYQHKFIATLFGKTVKKDNIDLPPNHTFRKPKHIILTVDDKDIAPQTIAPLQQLATQFGAKVTLLNVNSRPKNEPKNLDLDRVETTYREIPLSGDINTSIKNFIEQEDCDLLCMIKRKKGVFEEFFSTSITKNQVFTNQVPLLVLPE